MHKIFFIIAVLFAVLQLKAQEAVELDSMPPVQQNDSMIFVRIEQVDVHPQRGRKLNYRRYTRLVSKIRKVYPFAVDAAKELEKYNEKYEQSTSDRERKRYVKEVEKMLFERYESELRRFTISEGRYLMLLIDRETGEVSYSIIKELKGGLPAAFWQGIAKIFRNDLKEPYDPLYRHYVIEQIVRQVEKEYQEDQKNLPEK